MRWDESAGYKTDPAQFDGFFAQEGNRTYIPNEFFDLVIRHENLAVIKVVGAVIRNTIGWTHRAGHRRQNVRLSFTDIQHRTLLQSRTTLSDALKEALEKNYILKIEQGFFDPQAGFESKPTTYGVKWLTHHALMDTGSEIVPEYENETGSEIVPEKIDQNRFRNRTGSGSEIVPDDRFRNRTDIKIKQQNKTSKQQQTPEPHNDLAVADTELVSLLKKQGFADRDAQKLAGAYPPERIQRQIDWLPARKPGKNPTGLLRKAIEDD